MNNRSPISSMLKAVVVGGLAVMVVGWMWSRWATWHVSSDEFAIALWLALAGIAFFVAYSSTRMIRPESRYEFRAVLKAAVRAFPWAFLLTPSIAFGFIALPMPAGLLTVGWLCKMISHAPYVQGPHNATGPIACMAIGLSWMFISAGTLFGLKLRHEKA
jgi:hypothetical protein